MQHRTCCGAVSPSTAIGTEQRAHKHRTHRAFASLLESEERSSRAMLRTATNSLCCRAMICLYVSCGKQRTGVVLPHSCAISCGEAGK